MILTLLSIACLILSVQLFYLTERIEHLESDNNRILDICEKLNEWFFRELNNIDKKDKLLNQELDGFDERIQALEFSQKETKNLKEIFEETLVHN